MRVLVGRLSFDWHLIYSLRFGLKRETLIGPLNFSTYFINRPFNSDRILVVEVEGGEVLRIIYIRNFFILLSFFD